MKLRGLTGTVRLTVICQNPTPCHRCRIKFWSFCRTSCEKILILSIKRFRKGEIMTHFTKINWLTYAFFLLILILWYIRIIIPFAWASLWAFFFESSLHSIFSQSRSLCLHRLHCSPVRKLQACCSFLELGSSVTELLGYHRSGRGPTLWHSASTCVCMWVCVHVLCKCMYIHSCLISAMAALRPVSHVRGCCRAPCVLYLRLLLGRR